MFEESIPAASAAEKTGTILLAASADDTARWPLLLDLLASSDYALPDPTAFLNRFLRHLSGSVSANVGRVYGRDGVQQRWRPLAQIGLPDVAVSDAEGLPPWEALADLVSKQEGLALFSDDVVHDARCDDPVFQSAPFRAVAGVVLQSDRKVLGALLLGGSSPGALSANDSAFFLSAANLLIAPLLRREPGRNRRRWASDIPPAGFNGQESRQKASTDRVVEWLRGFVTRPDPATLPVACDDFLKQIVSRIGADTGVISKWDDLGQRGESVATIETPAPDSAPAPSTDPTISDPTIAEQTVPTAPTDVPTSGPPPAVEVAENVPRSLEVPIPGEDGAVWGHLTLQRRKTPFPPEAHDVAGLAAKVLGKTIAAIARAEHARRHLEEAEGVDQMAHTLVKHRAPEPMLTEAADRLAQAFDLTACAFFCFDERRILLQGLAASGTQGSAVRKITVPVQSDHLVALTARNKEPIIVDNARADDRIDKRWANLFRSRAVLFLPLLSNEQVIGVVALDDNRAFRKWTPEQIDRAIRLTGPIALALDNAIQHHAAMAEREAMESHARSIADAHEAEQRRMARRLQEALEKGIRPLKTFLARQKTVSPPTPEAEVPTAPESGGQEMPPPVPDEAATDSPTQAVSPLPTTQPQVVRAPDWGEMRRQVSQMEAVFQGITSFLHSPQLERAGILAALNAESEAFAKRSGVVVHFKPTATTPARLPPPTEALLYRIVQETFNNVARHAEARAVVLSLEKKGPNVHLTVSDDGKGFDAERPPAAGGGVGLVSIRERVELAGGRFSVDSAAGRGTRISVVLPVARGAPTPPQPKKEQEKRPRRR